MCAYKTGSSTDALQMAIVMTVRDVSAVGLCEMSTFAPTNGSASHQADNVHKFQITQQTYDNFRVMLKFNMPTRAPVESSSVVCGFTHVMSWTIRSERGPGFNSMGVAWYFNSFVQVCLLSR